MMAEKAQDGTIGFCCAPGLTERDIADILGILPSGLASHMPIVAMGSKNAAQPDSLVLASVSLLHLFGVKNLDGLSRFLSLGRRGRSLRLGDFAATLVLDAAPLTERLRFRIGPSTKTITFLCRRVGAEGAPPLFVGAVLDVSDLHERAHSLETHARLAGRAGTDAAGQRDEQIELEPAKGYAHPIAV